MSQKLLKQSKQLKARKYRIRKKIKGAADRPRVTVFFSNREVSAQVIDDDAGVTIASASSGQKDAAKKGKNKDAARWVGETVASRAIKKGVTKVVFDRNGRLYHGKVKELAEAMRQKGLLF